MASVFAEHGSEGSVITTRHFELHHRFGEKQVAEIGVLLETACERFETLFGEAGRVLHAPEERLVWLCFEGRDGFEEYAYAADGVRLGALRAYYSARTNRVAMVLPDVSSRVDSLSSEDVGDTIPDGGMVLAGSALPHETGRMLTHELAHQLAFNLGLQRRGVVYPLWVAEGLALHLEYDRLDGGGAQPTWRERLIDLRDEGRLMPLRSFLICVPSGFRDMKETRARYAQAWGLFDCVMQADSEALFRYLAAMKDGPIGRRPTLETFIDGFGTVGHAEELWRAYLAALR